ncbi:MAG: cation transporter [Magnetococcales bacterium]|nr:cation transporter [Magnetococcales bacterium]
MLTKRAPDCGACLQQAARLDLLVALGQTLFSAGMGFLSGSMALHAFALQSLGDMLTKTANLLSIRTARRPPSPNFPYGYGKIQFLSAFFIGVSLLLGALFFQYENLSHLNQGMVEVPGRLGILAALVSGLVCEIMYSYMDCVGRENNNLAITASAWDNRSDALSSLAALAGILLANLGFPWADHLAALGVSLLVIRTGFRITSTAARGLLDAVVPTEVLSQVRVMVAETPEILECLALRGRPMGDHWEIDLQVAVAGTLTTEQTHRVENTLINRIVREVKHTGHVHISFVPQNGDSLPSRPAVPPAHTPTPLSDLAREAS